MSDELTVVTDMRKVSDLADRIAEFLPQSKMLPKDTRLTIAQIALAHRLDPFLGDIWAIPERQQVGGEWQVTGYRIMIGISAWRRSAHDTGEYWGRRYEKVTDEERKWLGATPNDLAIKCIVMRRKTGQPPMEFDGFGIFKAGEKSKMNPLQCVRLRAERDALKGAFPIGFGGGAVKIGVADDTGEEINGDLHHGPAWDVIVSETQDEHAPEPEPEAVEGELIPPTEEVKHTEPEAPKDKSTTRKASVKQATLRCDFALFGVLGDKFAKSHPRYATKDGTLDRFHFLKAAGAEGYDLITDENMEAVFNQVAQRHAIEEKAESAA